MKTLHIKLDPASRKWWVVDLKEATAGRVAVHVANVLRGKNKPIFSPHVDNGDHVIAVNAAHLKFGLKKLQQKTYYHYSGYPGGLRQTSLGSMMSDKPDRVFRLAVQRMLPKNRLAKKMIRKLHVYAGPDHPHQAQKPEKLELK